MFLLFSFVQCQQKSVQLNHNIGYTRYCPQEPTNVTFISPDRPYDFIIALVDAPKNAEIYYAQPVGTEKHKFNLEFPAYRFPRSNAEVIAYLNKDECITFAYASLARSSCMTGIKIYVNETFTHTWNTQPTNLDSCIFFAPPAKQVLYDVECNFTNDKIIVYREEMSQQGVYETIDSPVNRSTGLTSFKPFIFRLETQDDHAPGYATIKGKSLQPLLNPYIYSGNLISVQPAADGILKHNYAVPIVGTAPAIVLTIVWIYAFLSVLHKKPYEVKQKSPTAAQP